MLFLVSMQAAYQAAAAAAVQAQAASEAAPATITALSYVAPPSAALKRALGCRVTPPPPPRFSGASTPAASE